MTIPSGLMLAALLGMWASVLAMQTGRDRPAAKLKHDKERFVLSFSGGSIDIDGSTIYYDSGARAWRKYHNDDDAASGILGKLTEGLSECKLTFRDNRTLQTRRRARGKNS